MVCLVARAALRADFFVCHESSPGLARDRRSVARAGDPRDGIPLAGRKQGECRLRARPVNLRDPS